MTDKQIEFILSLFKISSYDRWKEIATKLLINDYCVVAGNTNIWKGSIGKFIKLTQSDNLFECVKYSFDWKSFLSSNYFQNALKSKVENIKEEIDDKNKELNELNKLII